MSDGPPERWIFQLAIKADIAPAAVTARRVLKHLLRSWGIRCVGYSEDRKTVALQTEVERLRQLVQGLAARVAEQSELLARRAERKETAP